MSRSVRVKKVCMRRTQRLVLTLNEQEAHAIDVYCQKHKRGQQSRTAVLREILLAHIIQELEADSGMLFSEDEMR